MVIEIDREGLIECAAAQYLDYNTYLDRWEGRISFSEWLADAKEVAKSNLEGESSDAERKKLHEALVAEGRLEDYENCDLSLEEYAELMLDYVPAALFLDGFKIIKK